MSSNIHFIMSRKCDKHKFIFLCYILFFWLFNFAIKQCLTNSRHKNFCIAIWNTVPRFNIQNNIFDNMSNVAELTTMIMLFKFITFQTNVRLHVLQAIQNKILTSSAWSTNTKSIPNPTYFSVAQIIFSGYLLFFYKISSRLQKWFYQYYL